MPEGRGSRGEKAGRAIVPMLVLLALAACATVPSPEILSVPAGPDALLCGAGALEAMGYETREVEPGVVEANSILRGLPAHADRHVVELRMADGDDPALVATVSRWRYQPSEHSLPIRRQAVNQARPDGEEVEAIRAAVARCGRE